MTAPLSEPEAAPATGEPSLVSDQVKPAPRSTPTIPEDARASGRGGDLRVQDIHYLRGADGLMHLCPTTDYILGRCGCDFPPPPDGR